MPEFLGRFLSRSGVAEWLSLNSVGSTMENLNSSIVGRIPLLMPPLEEQRSIVAHVATNERRLVRALSVSSAVVDKLRDYRQALITAAVTGKLDVAGEAAA
jgi:type I restriction enzyme S subunit